MDARWTDVQEDFCRAANHFKMSRMIFDNGGLDADSINGYMARMALMHSMQTGYTSFEDGLNTCPRIPLARRVPNQSCASRGLSGRCWV